jgi:hypothetical protein
MFNWVLPVLGVMLLIMGRRLFWFFVAVAGFAAGLQIAPILFGSQSFGMVWMVGLICGVIGALLALFFQKVAIAAGGFLAGFTLALHLLPVTNANTAMLIGFACGIAGAVALFMFFDWVLIFLSALIGASLVVDSIGRHLPWPSIVYILLAAVGITVQARWMSARRNVAG